MNYIRFANDGWYARYDEGMGEKNMIRVADAIGALWSDVAPGSTCYVGYDTRRDAAELAQVVASTLGSWGLHPRLSDIYCPMPALNRAVRVDDTAVGGVMLTADHRGPEYLGIRVRNPDGSAISHEVAARIEELVSPNPVEPSGSFETADLVTAYMQELVSKIDVDAIKAAGITCVVDPLYGTAKGFALQLARAAGADATEIHNSPVEDFGGLHPEVVMPWLRDLEAAVLQRGAAVGIALDGPSNRACAVTEKGHVVPPPKLTALVMQHLVENRGETGRVLAPQSASAILRRQAERLGCPMTTVSTDPVWAREEARSGGVLLSGDGLGGVCIPSIDNERDALAAMLLVLEMMAVTGKPLSVLVDDLDEALGKMVYGHRDVYVDPARVQVLKNLLPGINPSQVGSREPVSVSHADGLRVQYENDAWLLVRPSATQPLIRIYAEAPTKQECTDMLDAARRFVETGF
jgi:phosphomannomutase